MSPLVVSDKLSLLTAPKIFSSPVSDLKALRLTKSSKYWFSQISKERMDSAFGSPQLLSMTVGSAEKYYEVLLGKESDSRTAAFSFYASIFSSLTMLASDIALV